MQIRCDTHTHTVASDHAYSTVHDYWAAAKRQQLQLFASTDHAASMPDGAHDWHFGNMKVLPRVFDNIAMLRGIESNILPDNAGVDIPDGMRPYLDIAIASFHEPVFAPSDPKSHSRAAIAAFETGKVQVFGHPGNPNFLLCEDEVIRAAKDNNVVLEINNSSFGHSRAGSEPVCTRLLELVDKHDWKVVFASDSHSAFQLGGLANCIAAAQKVGFPQERVVSATPARLLAFLAEHDKPVAKELAPWLAGLSD
ncbi:MAG TPA: phosphatase [Marinagarivorans sp.]|nr:phosphatase [Marinobacter sp.]